MTNLRQTLLTSFIAAGLAFLFGAFFNSTIAQSQTPPAETRGPYGIANGDRFMVWRIDQATGKVSYCQREQVTSTDPKYVLSRRPYCSGWSN